MCALGHTKRKSWSMDGREVKNIISIFVKWGDIDKNNFPQKN